MSVTSQDPPPLGGDPTLPLKDKISAAVRGATGAESPVNAFFQAWNSIVGDYKRFVHELEGALKIELDNAKIRATVSSRVKSNSSIDKSIQRRQTSQERSYTNLGEIFQGIHDLAGLRIVVDFPPGIQAAQSLVKKFEVVGESKFASDRDLGLEWKARFGSFESTNYRVKIHPAPDHALYIYRDVLIEIQVLSLAESLYNKLAHPLVYKKTSGGQLSVKDQKLIDVSHGLSLCYWICLSSMQDQLEGQEMPESVRKIGSTGEDAEIEQHMSKLVNATPRLPTSDGTISISVLLDFIRESQTQQTRSFGLHFDKLVELARHASPTTINNFGSGHTSNSFGNISNSSGFGHVNHAPATYNNYYTENPSSSSAYVKALFITDPRVDKDEIQDEKGGLLMESSNWILEHEDFKNWDRGDTSGILWINGEPGKGKTMLMCRIVDELSSKTKSSYFFCKANEPDNNNATSVLRGLMYLLIQEYDVAMSCFEKECQRYGPQYFENKSFTLSQLRKVLRALLEALSPKHIYLAVDALDECVEGQRELLELITGMSQLQHVRWVVSSRNKPLIRERLERASTSISLEQNDIFVSEAVSEYIKHKTTAIFDLKRYEESMMQGVMEILSSKAQSTFLWVSLACQMLANRESFDPMGALSDFPSGLDSLYGMMLKEIRSASRSKLYQQIMNVALTVLRPVSLHELQFLTPLFPKRLSDNRMIEVIQYCGCFLSVRDSFVHFVHESAKDFLLNPEYGFGYDPEQQHYQILVTSLSVMSTLQLTNDFEPLKYPCTQWAFHISYCHFEAQARELRDGSHIDGFLRESYLEWYKALGYLGAVSNGILCMLELSRRVSGQVSVFAKLIREEISFMRYHRVGIEKTPNAVYAALVFSPTSSIIRRAYGEKVPKWITMKPDVDDLSIPIHSLEGHADQIKDISFSYDGRLLASASRDKTIRIWDAVTGESIHILGGHDEEVFSVAFCGLNCHLVSASEDIVIIWDAENGKRLNSIQNQTKFHDLISTPSVAISRDGNLICNSALEGFKLWNSGTGSLIRTFPYDYDETSFYSYNAVVFLESGNLLTAEPIAVVRLWNLESGELLYKLILQGLYTTDNLLFKLSTDDKVWIVGLKNFFLFDPCKKEVIEEGKRSQMAFHLTNASRRRGKSPLASDDSCYPIFEHAQLDWVHTRNRESNTYLLAASNDRNIEIWDLDTLDPSSAQKRPSGYHTVSFFPNGNFVISTTDGRPTAIWNFQTKRHAQKMDVDLDEPWSTIVATNDNIVAYVENGQLSMRNLITGVRYSELEDEMNKLDHRHTMMGTFSSDGRWIALGTPEHIHVYDIKKKKHCQHFKRLVFKNRAIAFSCNNRQLAIASTYFINIWDTTSWVVQRGLVIPDGSEFYEGYIAYLLFAKDNSSIMYSCYNQADQTKINIWNLVGGPELQTLTLGGDYKFQSFDSEMSLLATNYGVFKLTQVTAYSTGYTLCQHGEWVLWCNKPVLWLPPKFRPRNIHGGYAVHGEHKIVIGLGSDRILFLEFDRNGPTDLGQQSFLDIPLRVSRGNRRFSTASIWV
ncbi:hypothetical protein FSST1_006452 [Fusarium sambucinum]